jgi:hypothetical protein
MRFGCRGALSLPQRQHIATAGISAAAAGRHLSIR